MQAVPRRPASHPLIEIPRGNSKPASYDAPFFLTALPSEIRNQIYAILFERPGTILLVDWQALEDDYGPEEDISDHERMLCEDEHRKWTEEFEFGLHEGLGLLRTCRQIYHESVGVLYSNNRFMFTRAEWSHDQDFHRQSYVTDHAAKWLYKLGSQIRFLRNFTIDTDAILIHADYDLGEAKLYGQGMVHVLSIVRMLWKFPRLADDIKFKFTASGRKTDMDGEPITVATPWYGDENATVLNNIIQALCDEDQLNLRRCAFSDRYFEALFLDPSLSWGMVTLKVPDGSKRGTFQFEILDEGKKLRVERHKPPTKFEDFPENVLRNIFQRACFTGSDPRIIVDLERRKMRGINANILWISDKLHDLIMDIVADTYFFQNKIEFQVTITEPSSPFNNFVGLLGWFKISWIADLYQRQGRDLVIPDLKVPMKMFWRFSVGSRNIENYQVNAKHLLQILSLLHNQEAHLYIQELHENGHVKETGCANILPERAIFLLLSDVLAKWPERKDDPCPEIWWTVSSGDIRVVYPATSDRDEETMVLQNPPDEACSEVKSYRQLWLLTRSLIDVEELTSIWLSFDEDQTQDYLTLKQQWLTLARKHWYCHSSKRFYEMWDEWGWEY